MRAKIKRGGAAVLKYMVCSRSPAKAPHHEKIINTRPTEHVENVRKIICNTGGSAAFKSFKSKVGLKWGATTPDRILGALLIFKYYKK